MAEPETISPRGVPPIRTDWLADVARRLASVGLDRLRVLGEEQTGHLEDRVDGEPWSFALFKFSEPHDTVVEFDAELWAPGDHGGKPTLRAGFALAPRWDDAAGPVALVRTEIGPRGAVTFDPENWMVTVPLGGASAALPAPAGVEPGTWSFDGDLTTATEPLGADERRLRLAALGGHRLGLGALAPVLAGDAVPELLVPVYDAAPAKSKGFLGRLRGGRAPEPPTSVLWVTADGPIDAAWTGAGPADDAITIGLVLGDDAPVIDAGQATFRGPDGALTLSGPGLAVSLL